MLEIERKFLMKKYEGLQYLKSNIDLFDIEDIAQIYIQKDKNKELRIREITSSDKVYFTKTLKIGSGLVREEIEEEISEDEFNDLKLNAIAMILKRRFTFKNTSECFDFYSDGTITFEVEFSTEDEANSYFLNSELTKLLEEEVTGNKLFSNYEMATKF